MANEKTQQILNIVKELTILELADLVKALEEEFGVSAAPVAVAAGPGAGGEAAVEEKTEFDVELTGFDAASKLKVIKEVRGITGLSLGESKELVESAPKMVKTGVTKEEAEELKKQLEEVGGQITLK